MSSESVQTIRDFLARSEIPPEEIDARLEGIRAAMHRVCEKRLNVVFESRVEITERMDYRVSAAWPVRRLSLIMEACEPNLGLYALHIGDELVRDTPAPPSQETGDTPAEAERDFYAAWQGLLRRWSEAGHKVAAVIVQPTPPTPPSQESGALPIGSCDRGLVYMRPDGTVGLTPPNVEAEPASEHSPASEPVEESWREKPPLF